jgi:DNA-binding transcriptional LysR family regulator
MRGSRTRRRGAPGSRVRLGGARRPRITLDQLSIFLGVAQREHVTEAADALGLSQGSVSAAVRRLERTLGLPLFHRVGRNVRLTDVGRAVRHLAIQTLDDARQIEELSAGYLAFDRGAVAIAAGRVIGAHRLSAWVAPFARSHPDIDVHIRLAATDDALAMLNDGSADIAVVGSDVRAQGVESVVLESTELVIVAAREHPLAHSRDPMRELESHRLLAHERGSATQRRAELLLGRHANASRTIELEEGALLAALLAGIGFAAMPRSLVDAELASGRLVALPRPGRSVAQHFTAARRVALHTPAVDAFWRHLGAVASGQG